MEHLNREMKKLHAWTDDSEMATREDYFPKEWKKQIAEEKIVYSPYQAVDVPDVSFPEFIFHYLDKNGEEIFMIDGTNDRRFSYKITAELSKRVCSGLIRLGLRPGEVVAIFCDNCPEYVISFLAIASVGAIVAGITPSHTLDELQYELTDTEAAFLIVDAERASVAMKAAKEHESVRRLIIIGEAIEGSLPFSQLLEDDGMFFKEPFPVDPKDDVLFINYTSGTTGSPKGVMHTHFATVAVLLQLLHPQAHSQKSIHTLAIMSFKHTNGVLTIWFVALTKGTAVTLPPYMHLSEEFPSSVEKYQLSTVPLGPSVGVFLLENNRIDRYDWSSVKYIFCAGAPLMEKLEYLLREKFHLPIRQVYGMTETYKITITPMDFPRQQSVGIPVPSSAVKVLNTKTGKLCGSGEPGEICFRSPYIMKGYWKNPGATAEIIDKGGWLHTGDFGYYDEDGYFYVVDRVDDLIKYKSKQIAPSEIEQLVLTHPSVRDVAVVGVPDEKLGELPRAYVVPKEPNTVSEQEITDFVAERISERKHLKGGVIFLDKIPKSPAGKILRKELKKMHP